MRWVVNLLRDLPGLKLKTSCMRNFALNKNNQALDMKHSQLYNFNASPYIELARGDLCPVWLG